METNFKSFLKKFSSEENLKEFLSLVIDYTNDSQINDLGSFKYAKKYNLPNLYASVYASMIFELTGMLRKTQKTKKQKWANYILSHQSGDGLFRDPSMQCDIAESEDWWGWRHLTTHTVSALTFLESKSSYKFRCLEPLYGAKNSILWISSLPWSKKPDFASNTVMNFGVLLQYERDFLGSTEAEHAMNQIFSFLNETVSPETGLWGLNNVNETPQNISRAVQTSYHLWNLYFYEKRPILHVENAIDFCLLTQNKVGGYGININSSACEDIDTIDPLCRFLQICSHRSDDIVGSLRKSLPWILFNQMKDGGCVFRKHSSFKYGHELMTTSEEESNMFATWFRTLSIAYISQVLPELKYFKSQFHWKNCPGYQFWN